MKNNSLSYIFIFIFSVTFLFSCNDDNNVIDTLIGKMEATVDGTVWNADLPGAVTGSIGDSITTLITGISIDKKSIILTTYGDSIGVYQLNSIFNFKTKCGASYVEKNDTETKTYVSTKATIEITAKTENRISGTFSFKANNLTDSLMVENGKFENILIR